MLGVPGVPPVAPFPPRNINEFLDFLPVRRCRWASRKEKVEEIQGRPGQDRPPGVRGGADMPRYFFNVYYDRAELDEEGEELPDAQAAWHEATVTAGQIIQDLDGKLRPGQEWRLEVTDERATPIYVIHVNAERLR